MLLTRIASLIVLLPTVGLAQVPMTLKQVLPEADRAVVETEDVFDPGASLVATLTDGRQCLLKVVSQTGSIVTLDLTTCPLKSELRTGMPVERSYIMLPDTGSQTGTASSQETPSTASRSNEKNTVADTPIRFNLRLGYNTANSAKFDSVTATTNNSSGSGSYEFQVDSAFAIHAGAMMAPENSWGFAAGITYETKRNVNSEVLMLNGSSISYIYTDSKPWIQLTSIEGNVLYRWQKVYLPFGFNYSFPNSNYRRIQT